ncbi:SE-domain-containing protein [Mrakia frigida]|uniref:squalene monooxygenase n=1 Tax=Mrakia frigida TaxID=29902 RepID=UPI003FCBF74A
MSSSSSSPRTFDIIIVGGGVAGTALAYSLGTAGRRVLVVERDLSTPDRIVGELLQPGGCASLRALGMGDCLEGIDAAAVEGYYVCFNEGQVQLPYPPSNAVKGSGVGETASGLMEGSSFVHGKFIDALRNKVRTCPDVVMVEGTVKSLITDPVSGKISGIQTSLRSSPSINLASYPSLTPTEDTSLYAPLTIIADGCFSKFRSPVSPAVTVRSHFVGLVIIDAPLPAPRHGTVILSSGKAPVLLYQIGTHETRMLVDVKGKLPSIGSGALKKHLEETILEGLPSDALRACVKRALDESAEGGEKRLRVMPNSWLPARQQSGKKDREGCIVIGDAWNMRHPLTGGGMTVAFNDCLHLSRILSPSLELPDLEDWSAYAPAVQAWHWKRKNLSAVINSLSIALYDLFGADNPYLEVLQAGCFKYFELGGQAVAGPISLLSALAPKPLLLFGHFFLVAFYSIWCMFMHPQRIVIKAGDRANSYQSEKKSGTLQPNGDVVIWRTPSVFEYPGLVLKSFMVFYTACVVILPVLYDEAC